MHSWQLTSIFLVFLVFFMAWIARRLYLQIVFWRKAFTTVVNEAFSVLTKINEASNELAKNCKIDQKHFDPLLLDPAIIDSIYTDNANKPLSSHQEIKKTLSELEAKCKARNFLWLDKKDFEPFR